MPLLESAQTTALLLGTVLTAAGLSLGVLGINRDETSSTESTEQPPTTAYVQVPAPHPSTTGSSTSTSSTTATVPTSTAASVTEATASETMRTASTTTVPTTAVSASVTTVSTTTGQEPSITSSTATVPSSAAPAAPPPTKAAPVTEYLTYQFEGIADIIVALHDNRRLEFWSAIPAPGWAFLVEDETSTKVKIKFRPLDGGDEAEWQLKLRDGDLMLKQER